MKRISAALVKPGLAFALLLTAYLPTIMWMVNRWTAPESYYGHGVLIPLVSAFIVWQRRSALKKIKAEGDRRGLFIVMAGLLVHIVCAALRVYFISGFSFIVVLSGLILFFYGKKALAGLAFPLIFLLGMVPLPLVLIGNITVKLKLFAAASATVVLNHIGFPCIKEGSIIRMPTSYIAIEAPCSGLRSLISLMTLGLLFAYAMKASYVKKGVLFLSSAPIAIASNISRIVMLGMVNDLYGEKVALGFFHDFSGFLVFAFAFAGLFFVKQALEERPQYQGR